MGTYVLRIYNKPDIYQELKAKEPFIRFYEGRYLRLQFNEIWASLSGTVSELNSQWG